MVVLDTAWADHASQSQRVRAPQRTTEQALVKTGLRNLCPIAPTKDVFDGFERIIAGEIEPFRRSESPVQTARGEERDMEWHNALLEDAAGTIVGTLSSGTDVTERNRIAAALEQSEQSTES